MGRAATPRLNGVLCPFFHYLLFLLMKAFQIITLCSLGALTMSSSCEKESAEPSRDCVRTGYVIGLTPCYPSNKPGNPSILKGFILALESPADTVYTYNLPPDALTYFPTPDEKGRAIGGFSRGNLLFTPAVRKSTKITVGYYLTSKAERTDVICLANSDTGPFSKMTRDQEVTITCASKQD